MPVQKMKWNKKDRPFNTRFFTKLATSFSFLLPYQEPLPILPASPKMGVWAELHEIRSDYAQIPGCQFLMANGAGRRSQGYTISTKYKP